MADGPPPKPADGTKLPVTPEKPAVPLPSVAPSSEVSVLPNPPAAPASAFKIAAGAFGQPQPLPDIAPAEASGMKQPEAVKVEPAKAEATPPATKVEEKPAEKKKPLKVKIFEKGVDAAGFGEILKAWRSPNNRFRNVMKSIGSKAADMVAGRIVSMTFRLIAVTWVAGIIGGVSTFGGLALLALVTGAASSIYTYGKEYLYDKYYGPKEKRADVKFVDKARVRSAGIAFATGTFNGALGAWLAKTGILQNLFGMAKDFVFSGGGLLSQQFNDSAGKALAAPVEQLKLPSLTTAFSVAVQPDLNVAVPDGTYVARSPLPELAQLPGAHPPAQMAISGFKRY